jgi:hypothetical protein
VLFIPLAVAGYVRNITKVLERCQILEWKKDFSIRANYMVSVTNKSYVKMLIHKWTLLDVRNNEQYQAIDVGIADLVSFSS